MPEIGEQLELTVEKLVYGGQGLGHVGRMAVFVPRTAPQEGVRVRIGRARRDYAIGELVEVIEPSAWRVAAPCPYYERCGGCQLQHLSYADQLRVKTDQVRETLERIGGFPSPPVREILPAEKPFGYRNKAIYHCRVAAGRLLIGLIGLDRNEVVDLSHCPLQPESSNRVLARIRAAIERTMRQTSLDPTVFRHVMIRTSEASGQSMAVLVVERAEFPGKDRLLGELEREREGIDAFWLNVNPRRDHSVLGEAYESLWGPFPRTCSPPGLPTEAPEFQRSYSPPGLRAGALQFALRERVGTLELDVSPEAFFQIHTSQAEKLVGVIRDYAALSGEETVLDAYCGVGLFSLALAGRSREVYGIELSRQATLDAIRNAELNGITNCRFRTGKAERLLQKLFAQGVRASVAVLDPPRRGCHPQVLDLLPKMGVRRILYVSCSPPTLARDLKALAEKGYGLREVQPLDMFPQTYHVECVALFSMDG